MAVVFREAISMIWELIKHFIKKLPGIRYVVEGRDRYIQLYTDLLNDKNRLERQLLVLEDSIAKREQALASLNEENGGLKEENRNYKDKVDRKSTRLNSSHIH